MTPYYTDDAVTLWHGDCLDVLRDLPDASVDAVVTDPPYELGFMGKGWDTTGVAYRVDLWRECLRVLKPGGHLLAFGGTRTWHRLACAIEDAGFEVRDSIAWLYGSGFPKSLDVSKAIDKAAGAEREVVGVDPRYVGMSDRAKRALGGVVHEGTGGTGFSGDPSQITAPATDDARRWQGWGTALKPAHEPVVVARKPLAGTVAANVLAHGTGALNIDGCRIGDEERWNPSAATNGESAPVLTTGPEASGRPAVGRWPANVVLDETQAAELDRQSGVSTSVQSVRVRAGQVLGNGETHGAFVAAHDNVGGFDDTGGASRFFKVIEEDSWTHDPASTAGRTSPPPSASDASAPSGAATSERPDTERPTGSPSTSATPSASRPSGASGTTTPTDGARLSSEPLPGGRTPTRSRASDAATNVPTGTTTTTTSPSSSSGSVGPATSSDTSNSKERGEPLDEVTSRFIYCAKAPTSERPRVKADAPQEAVNQRSPRCAKCGYQRVNVGESICKCEEPEWVKEQRDYIAHPTVKPLDLMRWLVRLVTPPGGIVLEPFAGSGTTAEACVIEGFRCIAVEREADYLPLIVQRLTKPIQPDLFGGAA